MRVYRVSSSKSFGFEEVGFSYLLRQYLFSRWIHHIERVPLPCERTIGGIFLW